MPTPHKFDPPLTVEELASTPLGRCLLYGRLVATAVSDVDGKHITVRFSAKSPPEGRGRWRHAPLADARKCFIDVPGRDLVQGDSIGDFNFATSTLWASNSDQRRVNAARYILLAAAGRVPGAKVKLSTSCLMCGRPLTDPVSIDRNIGPECYGKVTGSEHQRKGLDTLPPPPADLPPSVPVADLAPQDTDGDYDFLTLQPGQDPRDLLTNGREG